MANKRWINKNSLVTPASDDRMPITDVSDTNTDKYVTPENLSKGLNANNIPNTPSGDISSTDIQSAINELDTEKGDVSSSSNITDNAIVRGDGGSKGVQESGITIDDSDNIDGVNSSKFTPITPPTHSEGTVFYDSTKKTLSYYNEESEVVVNIGQEVLFRFYNDTGATITNGKVITNTSSGVQLADNRYKEKANLIAMVTHDVEDGTYGYATRLGDVGGLDTSSCPPGTSVYLGEDGSITPTRPDDGRYSVIIGSCRIQDAVNGSILINSVTSQLTVEVTDTNGFPADQVTGTTLSFVNATRTFTIAPTGSDFHFYELGDKFEKTSSESVVITDVEGLHVIYYDVGTLTSLANPTSNDISNLIINKCLIAYIYWDATNSESNYFAEERHGISMSPETHNYLHFTRGAQFLSGLALGNLSTDDSSVDAASAQFSVETGRIVDEDIRILIDAVGSTTGLPIYYLDGATGVLRRTTQTNFSIKAGTGTGNPLWNEWTGTTWQTTEVGNNDYCLYHVFAINGYTGEDKLISIMGQNEYGTVGQARAGATTEIASVILAFPFEESVPIATVIVQANTSYANDVNARLRSDEDGNDYLDWRTTELAQGVSPTDHNNLTNLQLAQSGVTWGHVDDQAQTFAGVKTFSSFPITPSSAPTTDYQVANKKYVDDNLGGAFSTTASVTSNSPGTLATDDFVFGSDSLDDDGNTDHDNRFLFDKSKGAFRAGTASGTNWDNVNRGTASAGFGYQTTASGGNSFACGYVNTASGERSFAGGGTTTASELVSFSWGTGFNNNQKYSLGVGYGSSPVDLTGVAVRLEADADQDDTKKKAIYLGQTTAPTTTTDRLYNVSGELIFNGNNLISGSTNITTVGTIGTGTWQGTAIADDYISSATTWNGKPDNLQEAFDGGQSITIADEDNQTFSITNNDVTNNQTTQLITNTTTGIALRINQTTNNGKPAFLYGNFTGDYGSNNVGLLTVENDSNVGCIVARQNGVLDGTAVSRRHLFYGILTGANTTSNAAFYIRMNNASSVQPCFGARDVGTGGCFTLDQDGNATAMTIDSEATSKPAIQYDLVGSNDNSSLICKHGGTNKFQIQRNDDVNEDVTIIIGTYHFWVDSTGDLRIKSSAPTSDTDGTIVGTQS